MPRSPPGPAALLCGLGVWLAAGADAGAHLDGSAQATPIALGVHSCSSLLRAAIGRVLAVELRDIPLAAEASAVARHHVTVSCNGQTAEIAVQTTAPPQSVTRLLALKEFSADDRPRAVALTAVELLATLDADIRRRVAPSVANAPPLLPEPGAPGPPPSLVSPVPQKGGDRSLWRVFATGGVRTFHGGDAGARVLGGGVIFSRRLGLTPLVLSLDADLGFAHEPVPVDPARAWLGSLGVVLGALRDYGPLTAEAGAGLRVGGVRWREPASERTMVSPWGGPLLSLRVSVQAWRASLTTSFEAGFAALGVQGTGETTAWLSAQGPWVALGVGVGTGF